jgi:uncharacterized protein
MEVILLDTNIWISYLLSHKYHILTAKIIDNNLDIVTCSNLINEISDVLKRDKFCMLVSKKDIREAINIHIKLCRVVEIKLKTDFLTDKKDNYLIDLYIASHATMLVTGDKQLLKQAQESGFNALTLNQFETQIP